MTRKEFLNALEWSFVIFTAINMCIYGGAKFVQFGEISEYKKPLSAYKGMQLMWAFYSYSKSYSIILGLFEILGSLLLIIPKTRIIGCFVLSSILINIILQDYLYGVHRGAMGNAITYQLFVFVILWFNREKLILMIKNSAVDIKFPKKTLVKNILLIIGFLIIIYILQPAIYFLLSILKI